MVIVPAKKSDVSEISNCRCKSIDNVNSKLCSDNFLSELIEDHLPENILMEFDECEIYSLKRRGKIVGNVSFVENKIDGLYILPEFSGKGYGKKLLKFAEKKIKKKGYWEVYLYSTLNSEKFYLSQGYSVIENLIGMSEEPMVFIEMAKRI